MKKITSILVALMACAALADETVPIRSADNPEISGSLTAYEMEKHRAVERYFKPQRGHMHVHVDVEIENTGAEHTYSSLRFKLIDRVNRRWDSWFGTQSLKQPGIGRVTLGTGEKVRGWVSFELPKDTILHGFKIKYDDDSTKTTSGDAEIPKYK